MWFANGFANKAKVHAVSPALPPPALQWLIEAHRHSHPWERPATSIHV